MSDDLRARLTAALKEVRLRLGPNALSMAQRGEPLMMSGNEREAAADVVLAKLQPELDRLRAVEADYLELTSKVHPLATCSHGVSTAPVATLARKIAEKREALAQRDEACREVDRLRAELAQHAYCAVCGHERHEHHHDSVIRAVFCARCSTRDDVHDFQEDTSD